MLTLQNEARLEPKTLVPVILAPQTVGTNTTLFICAPTTKPLNRDSDGIV